MAASVNPTTLRPAYHKLYANRLDPRDIGSCPKWNWTWGHGTWGPGVSRTTRLFSFGCYECAWFMECRWLIWDLSRSVSAAVIQFAACSLQFAVCSLEFAVCSCLLIWVALRFPQTANDHSRDGRKAWPAQATIKSLTIVTAVFPNLEPQRSALRGRSCWDGVRKRQSIQTIDRFRWVIAEI